MKKNNKYGNKKFIISISKYYKKFYKFFIFVVIFSLLKTFFVIIQPQLLNELLKSVFSESNNEILMWSLIMFFTIIFIGLFTFLSNLISGKMSKKIEIELRQKTINNLIKQDLSFYSKNKMGEILTKVISDTAIVESQTQQLPTMFFSSILTFIGSIIILYTIDWKLSTITLIVLLIVLLIFLFSLKIIREKILNVRKVITKINGEINDKISNVSLIKSSGTEEIEKKFFKNLHEDYYGVSNKSILSLSFIVMVFSVGLTSISTIVIISASIIYRNNPNQLFIILPSFLFGISILISPIMQFARTIQGLTQASASLGRIEEIINSKTRIDMLEKKDKIFINNINSNIVFDNISFSYPEKTEKLVIKNFSFEFQLGKSYAFVGITGAGKSTISKLLMRFYDPTKGKILINGFDLKDIYLPSYLSKIGYVEQEPKIIYGDFIDNVSYGMENVNFDDVVLACKKAKLNKLIESLPKKYNTILGERGHILSGGEKQRLVIARIFLKNPEILILDEATSSLDNMVESEISTELDKLRKGRTTFAIAHRLSTIKNFDKIIVIGNNKILDTGTFEELKNKKGIFKKLYEEGKI